MMSKKWCSAAVPFKVANSTVFMFGSLVYKAWKVTPMMFRMRLSGLMPLHPEPRRSGLAC